MNSIKYIKNERTVLPDVMANTGVWQLPKHTEGYCHPSFMPNEYWSLIDREAVKKESINVDQAGPGQWIAVLPIAEWIYESFGDMRKSAAINNEYGWREIYSWRGTPGAIEATIALCEMARGLCPNEDKNIEGVGVRIYSRKQPTLTNDPALHTRIGLHVDIFNTQEGIPSPTESLRFHANLGEHDHWFAYMDKTVEELQAWYKQQDKYQLEHASATDIAHMYVATNPMEPLYCFKTKPGEAYIAPGENCLHDGVVLDTNGGFDITLALRGRFHGWVNDQPHGDREFSDI